MAGKTKIGLADVGGSFAMAQGWKLIQDAVNANTQYGLFRKDGTPFYEEATGNSTDDNKSGTSTTLGGKAIDAVSGALDKFSKVLNKKVTVEVGVLGLNTNDSAEITNAPLEQGGFLSVNKKLNPTHAQIQYTVTGTEKQREAFLKAAKQAQASRTLFILYAGQMSIQNVNIVGVTTDRNAKSIQMFVVTLQVEQVLNTAKVTNPLANATAYSGTAVNRSEIQTRPATALEKATAAKRQP